MNEHSTRPPPLTPGITTSSVRLVPGHFYRSRNEELWCCFAVDLSRSDHCQADCIRVSDHRVEYFFVDGRYDRRGGREHTLVSEVIAL